MERITATYCIETPYAPEKAAAVLAGEQSSGTFVTVPGETEELKQRFAAKRLKGSRRLFKCVFILCYQL
jgi:ribulose-bisphosphate carboxylase large chain